jgi:uncharacterized protein
MRFNVVTLHFTNKCNLSCPFCYKKQGNEIMDKKMLLELPQYISELAPQVAVGGGEPLLEPALLLEFARECKKWNLLCNITTNGVLIDKTNPEVFDYLKMVSISIDEFKNSQRPLKAEWIKILHEHHCEVGANLLVNKQMFGEGYPMVKMVKSLFDLGFDRVFALYPKNFYLGVDIIKANNKIQYLMLTKKFKNFFVDDLTAKILSEGYRDWKTPCHYGQDVLNIDLDGSVFGCSFDCGKLGKIKIAREILQFKDLPKPNRMVCPFLKIER